jgi:hypothetical protein
MWYVLCLIIGACLGVLAMGFMRMSAHEHDCRSCKAYYTSIIRERDSVIHGLRSSKGALEKEVQNLSFRNAGYNAR